MRPITSKYTLYFDHIPDKLHGKASVVSCKHEIGYAKEDIDKFCCGRNGILLPFDHEALKKLLASIPKEPRYVGIWTFLPRSSGLPRFDYTYYENRPPTFYVSFRLGRMLKSTTQFDVVCSTLAFLHWSETLNRLHYNHQTRLKRFGVD